MIASKLAPTKSPSPHQFDEFTNLAPLLQITPAKPARRQKSRGQSEGR
ncbi:hypothetical protein [Pseudomonas jinjuensis]|nr:hypothetical protein [Pseudomonas jinjuensis]